MNFIRKGLLLPVRLKSAVAYYSDLPGQIVRWLFQSNESSNFTYPLTDLNMRQLASLIAVVGQCDARVVEGYLKELLEDTMLRSHIRQLMRFHAQASEFDADAKYGRRLGWYALARILKPSVVVETGVDKGLGSCVLTAALLRNAKEGRPGRYYGLDINHKAGFLLQSPYSSAGEIRYGDAIAALKSWETSIDLFISDSNHDPAYERGEYEAISDKLSPGALLISDNAHVTNELLQFAHRTCRQFLYFQEKPKHWYPGAGLGVAFQGPARLRSLDSPQSV